MKEGTKKALISVGLSTLSVVLAFAAYDFIVKPSISKYLVKG